jgi:hypothetical protein
VLGAGAARRLGVQDRPILASVQVPPLPLRLNASSVPMLTAWLNTQIRNTAAEIVTAAFSTTGFGIAPG